MDEIVLSTLGHTWIIDFDGTIVKHNGYKIDGADTFLSGALEFLKSIPQKDMIVFITSRSEKYREMTEKFISINGIKYHKIIFDAPVGERIIINDDKPSGLKMCIALPKERNAPLSIVVKEDIRL